MLKKFVLTVVLSVTAFGLVTVMGCIDPNEKTKRAKVVFSHKKHAIDEEIKCVACHKLAAKEEHAGMPTVKSCMKCHEGLDAKKAPELGVEANYVKDEKPVWSNVTNILDEVKFSHKVHGDARIECTTCHKGIESSKAVSSRLKVTKRECMECHAKTKVAQGGDIAKNNCSACHKTITKEWKPENHNQDWQDIHGRIAGFQTKNSNSTTSCDLCHTEQSCIKCHRSEQPKNHSNFWKERAHGITADLDRSGCKVCHTEDSCIRCHKTVAPNSHKGNFADQHCNGCHTPLKENGCVTCHKDTRSHLTANKLPSNSVHQVAKASDCRTCHSGLKLPHFDNGDDCLSCHSR